MLSKTWFYYLGLNLIILSVSTNLFAGWSNNPSVNDPVCTAANNQLGIKMISDGNNGVIMVWEDNRVVSTGDRNIYAQHIDRYGNKKWGDVNGLPIAVKPVTERYYDICTDGKGGAFIFWDDNPTSTITYLKAQRITPDGTKLFSDTGKVIANDGNRQSQAMIAYDNNGGCYFAYQSSELSSTDYDLKANRLDSNGNKLWGSGVWFCNMTGIQQSLDVCVTSDNNFFISWGDPRTSPVTDYDIYCQKLSPGGIPQWQVNGVPVVVIKLAQEYQKVYPDNSGGAYVTWVDRRDSIENSLYVQRIKSSGQPAFVLNGLLINNAPDDNYGCQICTDGKGGSIISWFDYRNGPSFPFNIDIYAQRVDSNGTIKWQNNGVRICGSAFSQINNKMCYDGNYGAIITWDDRRNGTSIYDIYAQRVDSSGNVKWDTACALVSNAPGNQLKPQIVSTNDGAIICFEDTRSGSSNYDIYAMKLLSNGGLVAVNNNTEIVSEFTITQNFPNPFNPQTRFDVQLKRSGFADITIYDVMGREIQKMFTGYLSEGKHTFTFDGRNYTSGIYFYRVTTAEYSDVKQMMLIK
ncbi:hypothetical protein BH10BAC5_BH10BAC5_01510 [soil metagenome]